MTFMKKRRRKSVSVDAVEQIEAQQAQIEARALPDFGETRGLAVPGSRAFFRLVLFAVLLFVGTLVWRWVNAPEKVDSNSLPGTPARIENILPRLKLNAIEPPRQPEVRPSRESALITAPSALTDSLNESIQAVVIDPVMLRRLSSGLQAEKDGQTQSGAQDDKSHAARIADSGPMSDRLQPMKLVAARAERLGNRDMLITQGAMIDCVQDTKLVSAQTGMVTCYAPHDIRSTSGRVVLIDGGTKFVGYQQGVLAQGQPRIGVVWSRLETPQGVVIHLDSPGTGALGEAGLDGHIDTHFAERFGGAILVSLISDVSSWAFSRGRSDSGSIRLNTTGDAAQDAISVVLDNSINIPPTLYRNQGGRMGIYVARDLDFSSVYDLRPVVH